MHSFTTHRKVEFSDTDMAGIAHFSRFFAFMENAEMEFLNSLGVGFVAQYLDLDGRRVGWPRVAASCEYLAPVRFGEELLVQLHVVRKGTKSLTYRFEIEVAGKLVATGTLTTVCCILKIDGTLESIPIPEKIAAVIQEAPAASV
ncbi:MAG TPA: thioesterase family protein [Thermoanaerobaculia bacterium]